MSNALLFSDRLRAGEQLAQSVKAEWLELINATGVAAQPIVYALPRGGIPVAAPVAQILGCPLDIVVAKKIALPENPELAIGAVTSDGHVLWSEPKRFHTNKFPRRQAALHQAQEKAQAQLEQLSPSCLRVNPQGAIAILVDDGIATGMTIAAAAQSLKAQNPSQVWICAPVAPEGISSWLQQWGERVIIVETPHHFLSVSRFYGEFPQVEIDEAKAYLQQHNQQFFSQGQSPDPPSIG